MRRKPRGLPTQARRSGLIAPSPVRSTFSCPSTREWLPYWRQSTRGGCESSSHRGGCLQTSRLPLAVVIHRHAEPKGGARNAVTVLLEVRDLVFVVV